MSDANIKNMAYFFAALLSIYPIIEIVFNKKKNIWFRIATFLLLCFFWYITVIYKHIIDKENIQANLRIKKSDSARDASEKENKTLYLKLDSTNASLKELKDKMKTPIQNNKFKIISPSW